MAEALWQMCRRDLLFYINAFVWTYDPRGQTSKARPFITWEFQDPALITIRDAIGKHDVVIEKSRDMGASWMAILVFEWLWHFYDLQSFLLVSRKEELVDKPLDPKSLFWKIDFIHNRLPSWLMPRMKRQSMTLVNLDSESTIDGESTTGDVARGDRRSAILLDEFAAVERSYEVLSATADATTCRIFNSTPQGTANAFYDQVRKASETDNPTIKLRFHWTQHPEKSKGLYYDADGKPRSPWYDYECKRRVSKQEIDQEINIDYLGSAWQFFDQSALDRHEKEYVLPPFAVGELDYDPLSCEPRTFLTKPEGSVALWTHVDGKGEAPLDRIYAIGCDIATGTGASNSVLSIGDAKTREKVGEFVSADLSPEDLAVLAVALAKWLGGAYLIWEANGPGRPFGHRVIDLGYRFIYYRQRDKSITRDYTDFPGFWATKETKFSLMSEYRRALASNEFINRSKNAIDECREYVYLQNGTVAHSGSARDIDPSGARENHGDRVTADALLWKALSGMEPDRTPEPPAPPEGSFMARRLKRLKHTRQRVGW